MCMSIRGVSEQQEDVEAYGWRRKRKEVKWCKEDETRTSRLSGVRRKKQEQRV